MKKLKLVGKVVWVKPKIKVEELTMRALLGENGWISGGVGRRLLAVECLGSNGSWYDCGPDGSEGGGGGGGRVGGGFNME